MFVRAGIALLALASAGSAQFSCSNAPTDPQDRRNDRRKLRVVSYNVEWLFDGTTSQDPWSGPEEAQKHLEAIAGVVAELNPDVLHMQEVQNCDMLDRLVRELSNLGVEGYRSYLVRGTDNATLQNVGMITRIDPTEDVERTSARYEYPIPGSNCGGTVTPTSSAVSKHAINRFTINNQDYTMFNHHFIAFPTQSRRCHQREAQSSVMRQQIDVALARGDSVITLGDFNDYSDRILDQESNVPTSRTMKILRDGLLNGTMTSNSNNNKSQLIEPVAAVPQTERFTAAYEEVRVSSIDHIVISPDLEDRVSRIFMDHSYDLFEVSDHWPVVLDLLTPTSTDDETGRDGGAYGTVAATEY